MIDTILLDLDGTLMPIDQDIFTKAYFSEMLKKVIPLGYEKQSYIDALWKGTAAMAANDGTKTNRDRFWDAFSNALGAQVRSLEPLLNQFYTHEFHRVSALIPEGYTVRPQLDQLKDAGYTLALATSPFFPKEAMQSRLSWLGADSSEFAHITAYENSHFSKPNPCYYQEIFEALHKKPGQCLMVGNHVREDIVPLQLGASVFLLTDYLENPDNSDFTVFPHGDWKDLFTFLEADRRA